MLGIPGNEDIREETGCHQEPSGGNIHPVHIFPALISTPLLSQILPSLFLSPSMTPSLPQSPAIEQYISLSPGTPSLSVSPPEFRLDQTD